MPSATTYIVTALDAHGDEVEHALAGEYDADREAREAFDAIVIAAPIVGVELEKCRETWRKGGDGIERRDYQTIATRGVVAGE